MRYLAVYKSQKETIAKPHKSPEECDKWLAEKMREFGSHNVQLFITEILAFIPG